MLPAAKHERQDCMQEYMKELLFKHIKAVVEKQSSSGRQTFAHQSREDNLILERNDVSRPTASGARPAM